ncbi:MAG: VWA domain-containing protein [Planctomycetes bacterium]|nr:VWA domain-containing protein [Planctomycetota bacterium]
MERARGLVDQTAGEPVLGDREVRMLDEYADELGVEFHLQPRSSGEGYDTILENDFLGVQRNPISTFSVDVDTAGYSNVRRFLRDGTLPPADAVRIEELVNYFPYDYALPKGEHPFAVDVEVGAAPWAPRHRLLRIGLRSSPLGTADRKPSNLVFLLDVSGSMDQPDKLPLVKQSLRMLVEELDARDRVSIVVYAGAAGVVLEPTAGDYDLAILAALERLDAGGSTNGGEGIQRAYALARENFLEEGNNRVVLATDGDFNVGLTGEGELEDLIASEASSGVFLTVLGFGTGNLQDNRMEALADKGNGHYAYIDSLNEARKVLVGEVGASLETVAKDVKIQLEFNPDRVLAYRLIGYENRLLAAEDFADDTKDAGEIGAGHRVTALYEIVPAGESLAVPGWSTEFAAQQARTSTEVATAVTPLSGLGELRLRYKQPQGTESRLLTQPLDDSLASFAELSDDTRFAAAVAGYGMLLRGSKYAGTARWRDVIDWAAGALGGDPGGYRTEFHGLAIEAQRLSAQRAERVKDR